MISNQLFKELGLLNLVSKQHSAQPTAVTTEPQNTAEVATIHTEVEAKNSVQSIKNQAEKIDKNEFRLLVKMLQAINHECQYDHIEYDGKVVKYKLPSNTLVFHDIKTPDHDQTINLSSLADLLSDPSLKRPVWEKLKKLAI